MYVDVWGGVQTSQYACSDNINTRHTRRHNTQIHGTQRYLYQCFQKQQNTDTGFLKQHSKKFLVAILFLPFQPPHTKE